jgi:hypothetical protein
MKINVPHLFDDDRVAWLNECGEDCEEEAHLQIVFGWYSEDVGRWQSWDVG